MSDKIKIEFTPIGIRTIISMLSIYRSSFNLNEQEERKDWIDEIQFNIDKFEKAYDEHYESVQSSFK